MQRHVIFLVHGMGVHPPGWSDDAWQTLQTAYKGLDRNHFWPWDEGFERVEIGYDDCFEAIRQRWREDAGAVLNQLGDAGLQKSALTTLADTAKRLGEDHFVTTHILDVVLYWGLRTVREAVKTRVGRQITDTLEQLPTGAPWSVVAHSLGTAVTHDTLHALAVADGAAQTAVRRAQVLMTLANVSRTLQTDIRAYASRVRPAKAGQPGIVKRYLNVCHRWDPIPAFWPFEPHDDWPDASARSDGRYREITLTALSDGPNVHALEHHLRDPACHVPLFRELTMPALIDDSEAEALRVDFLQEHPQAPQDAARRRLEKLARRKTGNHRDLIILLRDYFAEVHHA